MNNTEPYWSNIQSTLYLTDARTMPIPSDSIDCVVTSPPYWGLRDYSLDDRGIGMESTPETYCANMVEVFREVWRVLKPTGTVWLNLGDGYQEKTLIGIPWRVAFALQADGWYLRSDIIWSKPNPMPESVGDRPTKAHEYVFLLTKNPKYYYDADAIRESAEDWGVRDRTNGKYHGGDYKEQGLQPHRGLADSNNKETGRNKRSVWEIATHPYPEAHFATYPEKLVEPCILAGTSEKGVCGGCGKPWERDTETEPMEIKRSNNHPKELRTRTSGTMTKPPSTRFIGWIPICDCNIEPVPATVLDPFVGSGTTLAVSQRLGRKGIGFDLNEEYLELARQRIEVIPLPMNMSI